MAGFCKLHVNLKRQQIVKIVQLANAIEFVIDVPDIFPISAHLLAPVLQIENFSPTLSPSGTNNRSLVKESMLANMT